MLMFEPIFWMKNNSRVPIFQYSEGDSADNDTIENWPLPVSIICHGGVILDGVRNRRRVAIADPIAQIAKPLRMGGAWRWRAAPAATPAVWG